MGNLANNALKYGAPETFIELTLKQDEQQVWITIHNEGNPIAPSEQADLFSGLSMMKKTPVGQRGWGIGLVVVQGVIKAHGGSVKVESSPEKGTTFTIEIPLDARGIQTKAA